MHAFKALVVLPFVLSLSAVTATAAERAAGQPVLLTAKDLPTPLRAEVLQRQYAALSAMPSVTVTYSKRGPIESLSGHTGIAIEATHRNLRAGAAADAILAKFSDVLLAVGEERLTVAQNRVAGERFRHLRLEQSIRGIPVVRGGVHLDIEEATGLVQTATAYFLPDHELPRTPKLSASQAAKQVVEAFEATEQARRGSVQVNGEPSLAYFGVFPDSTKGQLVWAVRVSYVNATGGSEQEVAWIDALAGTVVSREPTSANVNEVYNVANTTPIPDQFPTGWPAALSAQQISADPVAANALNNTNIAQNVWQGVFGWTTPPLTRIAVRYNHGSPNATFRRWNSVDYVTFTGPSASNISYGDSLDVAAHEFGHSVSTTMFRPFLGDTADAQSAALSEGFSDFSSVLVDLQQRGGTPVSQSWVIGEVFTADATRGIRSLSNPIDDPRSTDVMARDWFPARHQGLADRTKHGNSTIMGHAYYLLVNGGFHARAGLPATPGRPEVPSIFVPGLGQDRARFIFRHAFGMSTMLDFPTFEKLRDAAEDVAELWYGAFERDAVHRAFEAVGLRHQCSAPPPKPVMRLVNEYCFGQYSVDWDSVPGATSYHVQRASVTYGWAFPLDVTDGNVNNCSTQIFTPSSIRMRACNGCGCSDWTDDQGMYYKPLCE